MSAWAANYLRNTLTHGDFQPVGLAREGNIFGAPTCRWSNLPTTGNENSAAEKRAADIKADLLIYGMIDTRNQIHRN